MGAHVVQHLIGNQLWRIVFSCLFACITFELVDLVVILQISRIQIVCIALAIVTIEAVEALLERIACCPLPTEAPFPETAGCVALLLERLGDIGNRCRQGCLTAKSVWVAVLDFTIVPDVGMPAMHPGHQVAA